MTDGMGYSVVKKRLTAAIIAQAEALVEEGRHTVGADWREPRTGFLIRFYPHSASFLLCTAKANITLGSVCDLSGQTARHLAQEAKSALNDGRDAKAYVRAYLEKLRAGLDKNEAHSHATRESARAGGLVPVSDVWTVDELITRFVEHKQSAFKEGRWRKQFQKLFDDKAFETLRPKKVCDVGHGDIFNLKRKLVPERARATARAARIVSQTVAMLDFALNEHAPQCGLLGRDPVWRAVSVPYKSRKRRRTPELREIARMLIATERHAALADGVIVASPTLRMLLFFIAMTAQRAGAAATLRRDAILAHEDRDDWCVAHFSANVMKGRADDALAHAVPLPPVLMAEFERLWAAVDPEGSSDFAFPAARGSGHIASTGLNALFRQLRGDAGDKRPATKEHYDGKPGPKPRARRISPDRDLFESYLRELKTHPAEPTHFVPHDIRRSLTNHLSEHGLGGAASAILAHRQEDRRDVTGEESLEERMERTTSRHYHTSQRMSLKTTGLELWSQGLEKALQEERARVEEIARDLD